MTSNSRADRFFEESGKTEQRSFGQRDRDRILYSLAFKRLANVTQVACPHEGYVFHNRLTHTLKVAQLARRIAEKLLNEQKELAEHYGGLDPDVVEAAALAHDLGHPPFGHVAESELNKLASQHMKDGDGFEGNAQSFRIVTVNEASRIQYTGLNLSRATLNAIMKYPWLKKQNDSHNKYGAYTTEKEYMDFAREGYADLNKKCLEAAIMDYADSIAYSIHDFDDFYKAGLIPVDRLKTSDSEFNDFINRWKESKLISPDIIDNNLGLFKELLEFLYSDKHYIGTNSQRADFATRMSNLIQRSLFAVKIRSVDNEGDLLEIDEKQIPIMKFLQRLVWDYVISNPQLSTQQLGQRKIIGDLFVCYKSAIIEPDINLIPPQFQKAAKDCDTNDMSKIIRITVDIISSFTDKQAVTLFQRFSGVESGSITDFIHN